MNITTSKQRSHLKSIAMTTESLFSIGKDGITPELTKALREALDKRELIKIHMLNNCLLEKNETARLLAERTGSEVVQVIGKRIVLFKYQKDPEKRKIEL